MKLSCPFCNASYKINAAIYPDGSEFQCTNCPNNVRVDPEKMKPVCGENPFLEDFHLSTLEMTDGEKFEMLDATVWGKLFPAKELKVLSRYLDGFQADPEQFIFKEHDTEKFLCVIGKGRVDILKEADKMHRKVLGRFKAGHVFGEMSLIDGRPRSAGAVARETTTLFLLAEQRFQELVENEPDTAIAIILRLCREVSMRLRLTSGKLVDYLAQEGDTI